MVKKIKLDLLTNDRIDDIFNDYKEKGILFYPYSKQGINKLTKQKIIGKDDLERLDKDKVIEIPEDYLAIIYFQFANNRDELAKLFPPLESFLKKYYEYPLFIFINNISKQVLFFNFQKNNNLIIIDSKGKDQTKSFLNMDDVKDSDPILKFGEHDFFYIWEKITFALYDGGRALYKLRDSPADEAEYVHALNNIPDEEGYVYLDHDLDKDYPYTKKEIKENIRKLKNDSKVLKSANNFFLIFNNYVDFQTLIDEGS